MFSLGEDGLIMSKPVMLGNIRIKGERVVIKKLRVSDITQRYIDWLNNPDINRYLSIKNKCNTHRDIEQYVRSYENTNNKILLGIFESRSKLHIGNVTLTHIDWKNKVCAVGIMIGDVLYHGKGYAVESLRLSSVLAFSKLKFCELFAGVENRNQASIKLFRRSGYSESKSVSDKVKFEIALKNTTLFTLKKPA
jgi:[ribosomal protein S5]-alanine N-acetyltransferase